MDQPAPAARAAVPRPAAPAAHPRRPGHRTGVITFAVALPALALLALLALGLQLRADLSAAGEALERRAEALAARPLADVAQAQRLVARAGVPARLTTSAGTVLAQNGPAVAWQAAPAPLSARLATAGTTGWAVRSGWIEADHRAGEGGRIELRQRLAPGAGRIGTAALAWSLAAAALIALAAALAAAWLTRRTAARTARAVAAAEALAAGRPLPGDRPARGDWRRLDEALRRVGGRMGELQGEAAVDAGGLGSAVMPLPLPAALRTPAGGRVRNEALERLVAGLVPADAAAVEDAVRASLDATGAVARRLELADGRVLEVESWALPGGRVVAVAERTEQERLRRLREGLSGAAARHLRAPVREIQSAGADLYAQVPAPLGPVVRRVMGAADRLERLVGTLLRGTDHDPAVRAARREPVGAEGLLWSVAGRWDLPLRSHGVRVEVSPPPADLPPVWTDPRLAGEVMDELLRNAASFTPRGGTVTLSAEHGPDGGVALRVTDTGPGLAADEVADARERFFRGRAAETLPGTGLGLGVAGALAERLDGRLTLTAGPGGRAALELPAARGAGETTGRRPVVVGATSSRG